MGVSEHGRSGDDEGELDRWLGGENDEEGKRRRLVERERGTRQGGKGLRGRGRKGYGGKGEKDETSDCESAAAGRKEDGDEKNM